MIDIELEKVRAALETPLAGRKASKVPSDLPIALVFETGSTNDDLKEAARRGSPPRVLIAKKQTSGRGRQGRSFFSEGGVYLSAILPPVTDAAPFITHIAAVAVAEAIRFLTGEKAEIKWVNDVFLRGKKVCGILCESVVCDHGRTYIVGVGVNVSEPKEGFPAEIAETAGTVPADESALAGEILKRLFFYLNCFNKEELTEKYGELCFLIGKEIKVVRGQGEEDATAVALSGELGLIVRFKDGRTEELRSGEVHLKLCDR